MEIIIFALAITTLLLFIAFNKGKKELFNERLQTFHLSGEHKKLQSKVTDLEAKVATLDKYQPIADIDQEIAMRKATSATEVESMIAEAQTQSKLIIEQAAIFKKQISDSEQQIKQEAKTVLSQAKADAIEIEAKAAIQLNEAFKEYQKIINDAEVKARDIAGGAYEAMKNAHTYENTVIAMKNIIRGYGDEYLKPTFSLLDDLAAEFGHTQAGQNLKSARDRNIQLIDKGLAAQCDYVEIIRKQTAVNFTLDAFNGKVDSILSKIKKDNYGVLEQKIKDAYYIVNNNGKAFRDARVTESYLESRLDELKWAVIVQELKWQEKEEQRILKEQIREEEKARREFERAIKEAEKEEELLRRLIDKAQKEVARAGEIERAAQLQKLQELEGRLKEAEEKNQRALSMAQQTKAGNVYVISNIGSFGEEVFKIGMTRRLEPLDRIRELGDASVPFDFDVHAMIYSDNAPNLERELHRKFLKLQLNKVNPRKEFFKIQLQNIQQAVEQLGIVAKWTLTAEAKQYRESLAITEAIKADKKLEREWEQYQKEIDPVSIEEEIEM